MTESNGPEVERGLIPVMAMEHREGTARAAVAAAGTGNGGGRGGVYKETNYLNINSQLKSWKAK